MHGSVLLPELQPEIQYGFKSPLCRQCHATRVALRERRFKLREVMKPPSFSGSRARLCSLLVISATVLVSAYSFASGNLNFGERPKSGLYQALDVRADRDSQASVELRPVEEDLQPELLLNHRCTPMSYYSLSGSFPGSPGQPQRAAAR